MRRIVIATAVEFLSADRDNPRAVSDRRLEMPAGTELVVRTVETIDSRNAAPIRSSRPSSSTR